MEAHAWGAVHWAQVFGMEVPAPCALGEGEAGQGRRACSWQREVGGLFAVVGGDGIVVHQNPAAVV